MCDPDKIPQITAHTLQVFSVLIIKLCACIAFGFLATKCAGFIKSIGTLQNLHWHQEAAQLTQWQINLPTCSHCHLVVRTKMTTGTSTRRTTGRQWIVLKCVMCGNICNNS